MQFVKRSISVWLLGSISWLSLSTPILSDPLPLSSLGEEGIDALKLHRPPYNLTGRKIAIGQVEIGRPGQFGVDKTVSSSFWVPITQVFFRNAAPKSNTNLDTHAHNVASIMISNVKGIPGIAPGAKLYSSAVGMLRRSGQPEECLAAQYIAAQNGGDVRAINFSFGETLREDPRPQPILDGNALLTQCIDWSARVHNVLYVVAGNQGKGGIPIPTDNFNGVNVAFSTRLRTGNSLEGFPSTAIGKFAKVDFANLGDPTAGIASRIVGLENNVGSRRAISLVAPGNNIPVINPDGRAGRGSGTSFAAPHVTASVALLQEFGDRQLQERRPQWTPDSRRHEVMKAVLMNSAEKLQDQGDGLRLGMGRTILDRRNQTWLDSDAYNDPKIPLNIQMGTGQLNVFRAYQQFSPGQWAPALPVPPVGWDYHTVTGEGTYQDYVLEKPLQAGSFVSVTLVWDRRVELQDLNGNQEFDLGEGFVDQGLNHLELYLLEANNEGEAKPVAASISDVDSVQHIFKPVLKTGRYKIRVFFRQLENQPTQPYAIAWWTVPAR